MYKERQRQKGYTIQEFECDMYDCVYNKLKGHVIVFQWYLVILCVRNSNKNAKNDVISNWNPSLFYATASRQRKKKMKREKKHMLNEATYQILSNILFNRWDEVGKTLETACSRHTYIVFILYSAEKSLLPGKTFDKQYTTYTHITHTHISTFYCYIFNDILSTATVFHHFIFFLIII